MKLPSPRAGPPKKLPAASTIVLSSMAFNCRTPLPVPVFTVTVYVAPLPATWVMEAPAGAPAAIAKSDASTPVTDSLKVTVKTIVAALVGLVAPEVIERTTGGVFRMVYEGPVMVAAPANGLVDKSVIEPLLTRSNCNVPSPVPVLTATM